MDNHLGICWPCRHWVLGLLSILTYITQFYKVTLLKLFTSPNQSNFDVSYQWNQACHLKQTIYRLHQTPRLWCDTLHAYSYEASSGAPMSTISTSITQTMVSFFLLLLYIDNILLTWNNHTLRHSFQVAFYHHLCMSFMGNLSHYLGVEYVFCKIIVLLTQCHYITKMFARPLS